jgi:hypothetical protein
MKTLSGLLHELGGAFAEGRDRPPCITDASSGRLYTETLFASLDRRLSPGELSFLVCCWDRQAEALEAARQDRLDESRRGFDLIWTRIRSESVSSLGQLLAQAMLEPAEAYLYYKLNDYDRATELILHATALAHTLATDFDLPVMSGHRLQLGLNLLGIQARRGDPREAVLIGGVYLDYIEGWSESLPGLSHLPRSALDTVPNAVLDYYFDKFGGKLALLLAGRHDEETAQHFRLLTHHAQPGVCNDSAFGARSHAWLRSKQLALRGESEDFLVSAIDVLRLGRLSEPSLWFATIMDVLSFCRSLGPVGLRLADRMACEVSELTDRPWAMTAFISMLTYNSYKI